ncbi:G patch domain-containing protein 1 [Cichlidogyrus casuarinus]|uniref:G patch domain-containing protein 1 n=1 Tax=Cichlidogyrus casuarinus TaxID=1844966 RepID=A0ABD2PWC0_9PLAT
MDPDEDEFAVTYGTPFKTDDQKTTLTGALKRQPVAYEQRVLNEKGRNQRFHGAFTGGFSAGYFNTVGSKKGWTPSTFVSNRSDKNRSNNQQRPEDFMDDEDLGLFGIAPQSVRTRQEYDDSHINKSLRKAVGSQSIFGHFDDKSDKLKDMIVPASSSLKDRMLRRMGFKTKEAKVTYQKELGRDRMEDESSIVPVTDNQLVAVTSKESNKDMEYPKIQFDTKSASFGLGYERLNVDLIMGRSDNKEENSSGFNPYGKEKQARIGIRGEAFGVGAQETEDADIYEQPGMSQYDFSISTKSSRFRDASSDEDEDLGGMIASRGSKRSKPTPFKDSKKSKMSLLEETLQGFHLSKNPQEQEFMSERPVVRVPADFRPFFMPICILSPQERLKGVDVALQEKKAKKVLPSDWKPVTIALHSLAEATKILRAIKSDTKTAIEKPFAETPAKQARYELFHVLMRRETMSEEAAYKQCSKNVDLSLQAMEQELDEFRRQMAIQKAKSMPRTEPSGPTAVTHAPTALSNISKEKQELVAKMLSSRFRSVGSVEMNQELSAEEELARRKSLKALDVTDPRDHAVLTESYGALTRRKLTWYPDSLLCKRMNVANPYPDSKFVGCPKDRRVSSKDPLGRRRRRRWDNPESEQDTLIAIMRDGKTDLEEQFSDESETEETLDDYEEELQQLAQQAKKESKCSALFANIFEAYEKGQEEKNKPKEALALPEPVQESEPMERNQGPVIPQEFREQLERDSQRQDSMALFKSIFASDEEEEDEEEESEEEKQVEVEEEEEEVVQLVGRDVEEEEEEEDPALAAQPHVLFAHLYAGDSMPVLGNKSKAREQEKVPEERVEVQDDGSYGPALPPSQIDLTRKISDSDSSEDAEEMAKSALKWIKQKSKKHKKDKKKSKKHKKHRK